MQAIEFELPYGGAAGWSVNHFKVGGNMRWKYTPEARGTRDAIITLVRNQLQWTGWVPKAPLLVRVQGFFRNKRNAIDLHNAAKLILDCIQAATGVNDKDMSLDVQLPYYGTEEPRILINVRQDAPRADG